MQSHLKLPHLFSLIFVLVYGYLKVSTKQVSMSMSKVNLYIACS